MAVSRDPHSILAQSIRFLGDDKKVGISPAAWSKWERGMTYPNALQIRKIEKILNIGFSDIIF